MRKWNAILILGGYAPSLVGFRGPLLRAMRAGGHNVVACAAEDDPAVTAQLAEWGVRYEVLPLRRAGLNPLTDLRYLRDLRGLIDRQKPDLIIAYTHKPVVYSALAMAGAESRPKVFALITGLGYGFIGRSFQAKVAGFVLRNLYRAASRYFTGVIFQNSDDHSLFRKLGLIRPSTPQIVVRGSGIDLVEFQYVPLSESEEVGSWKSAVGERTTIAADGSVQNSSKRSIFPADLRPPSSDLRSLRFLLIARMLADKGIREYVDAGRELGKTSPNAEFHLIGPHDPNPAAIHAQEIDSWRREGLLKFHGAQPDVRPFLRDCTVYVLPSYREGTPRTVLEAMATGRAVITTDAPGCRETIFDAGPPDSDGVRQGRNGFLVPVKSVGALVAAMRRFIDEPILAVKMGLEGRQVAEELYDVHKVNRQMMEFMGLALATQQPESP